MRIALPLGLRMVGGSGRVRIPRLGPGSSKVHPFRVIAGRPGDYHVTAPNFSYQDAMGRSRHVRLGGWALTAVAGSAPQPPATRPRHPVIVEQIRTVRPPDPGRSSSAIAKTTRGSSPTMCTAN